MAVRGPRCVEPSVLARERPSDRLHGLELSCISEGWRPCARPTARNVSKPVSGQSQHRRQTVKLDHFRIVDHPCKSLSRGSNGLPGALARAPKTVIAGLVACTL